LTLIVTDDNQIIRYDTVHECKINKSRHSLMTTYFVSEDLNKITSFINDFDAWQKIRCGP
jgi:hypothetical protein